MKPVMVISPTFLLVLLAFLPTAFSAAFYSPFVECVDLPDADGSTFEVCATSSGTTPSPAFVDGETIYIGGYSDTFTFVQGLDEGAEWLGDPAEADTGIEVVVSRDDEDICSVTVSGEMCRSCEYCGEGAYSAECTNLPNGRMVDCESTAEPYFPLTSAALSLSEPGVCQSLGMIEFGTNTNGLNCIFCAMESPDCEIFCVGTPVTSCGPEHDISECCESDPCASECNNSNLDICNIAYCSSDPPECTQTICPAPEPTPSPPAPEPTAPAPEPTAPAPEPTASAAVGGYVQIQGITTKKSRKMCWEVRNGSTRKGNKIILAKCHKSKEEQKFMLKPVQGSASVMVHPKLDPKKVVVGVRETNEKGWLRIEKPGMAMDQSQVFSANEDGTVRIGSYPGVQFLYVTNQGLNANVGDPVMLSTGARLAKYVNAINGDVISTWAFV